MDRLSDEEGTMLGLIAAGAVLTVVAYAFTGCSGMVIAATPEGLREWGNAQSGLVAEGKASPDQKGAYWQLRELREVEQTKRETSPGWLSKMLSNGGES